MLLTYIGEIYLIFITLSFTFAEPFDDIFLFVKSSWHWSAEIQTKVYGPRSDQASEFALAHLTLISHSAK